MIGDKAFTEVSVTDDYRLLTMIIPASVKFSFMIRDFIGSSIKNETRFSDKWKHRLQLMADELVNNAIEHGSSKNKKVIINLKIYNNSDLELKVEDTGTGKCSYTANDLLEKAKLSREIMLEDPTSNKTIRGRGLAMIVLKWADDFRYENNSEGGLTGIIVKKYIENEE